MAVELIAEIAQGYEGDAALARRLAQAAVRSGADAVKFQLVFADELATRDYEHYALFKSLELSSAAWAAVAGVVKSAGAGLYFDVFGTHSLAEAKAAGADGVKIHSTDFFNARLVQPALAQMPKVFVSLGGITPEELEGFLTRHHIAADGKVCFLYGFQADPTPVELTNLRRLSQWQQRFAGHAFGFMDHVDGDAPEAMTLALLALPLGVACIEKHLTLDRALALEDYVSGLPPAQFKQWTASIRRLEQALGDASLQLSEAEQKYRQKAMKTVVASRTLKAGETVTEESLSLKRSAKADPKRAIYRLEDALGRKLRVQVEADEPLTHEVLA